MTFSDLDDLFTDDFLQLKEEVSEILGRESGKIK